MRRRDDAGTATAEFAVAVPAAVIVLALTVGAMGASGRQVRLEHAAAQAARLSARGEPAERARSAVTALVSGGVVDLIHDGDVVCADVSAPAGIPLPFGPLHARSCALAGGA